MHYNTNLHACQRMCFWVIANLGAWLVKLIFNTCRIHVLTPKLDNRLLSGQWRVIGATWHRAAIFLLYYYRHLKPAIMISRSKDGELLAYYLKAMGGIPIRGSSSQGGIEAFRKIEKLLKNGQVLQAATVADGPRGPRYQAKAGMILLAARTGLPLLPLMWSADRVWVFKKSWDWTMIPKPFANIKIIYGREMYFSQTLNKKNIESARLELERELNFLRHKVDSICDYNDYNDYN